MGKPPVTLVKTDTVSENLDYGSVQISKGGEAEFRIDVVDSAHVRLVASPITVDERGALAWRNSTVLSVTTAWLVGSL